MRGIFLLTTILIAASHWYAANLHAQTIAPPAIEWQRSYGGSAIESDPLILQTADGGYIMAVESGSPADGNKTSTNTGGIWILRLDQNGNKIWEHSYDNGSESVEDIKPAHGGGWFIASSKWFDSGSGNPFTGPNCWLFRIDDNGNMVWQTTLGLTNFQAHWPWIRMCSTSDGGLVVLENLVNPYTSLVGGLTVFRLNASGEVVWITTLGGYTYSSVGGIEQTDDGRFLVGASYSYPATNSMKTSPSYGDEDYWLVCLDANGAKLWDQSYGGASYDHLMALHLTKNGGAILGGYSSSPPSGNKTSPCYGPCSQSYVKGDAWIIEVDSSGNKLWENSYGGTNDDSLLAFQKTSDGGIILAGSSGSPTSGNKTSPLYGVSDVWLVRLDQNHNKLWEQCYGGNTNDWFGSLQQTRDGGFVFAAMSQSGISGNKTTAGFGNFDAWIVKLAPDALSAPPRLRLQAQSF